MRFDCSCLYCGKKTGFTLSPKRVRTVCQRCVYHADRNEALEVAAGMQPWINSDHPYAELARQGRTVKK
jgi:hypothetical protein